MFGAIFESLIDAVTPGSPDINEMNRMSEREENRRMYEENERLRNELEQKDSSSSSSWW